MSQIYRIKDMMVAPLVGRNSLSVYPPLAVPPIGPANFASAHHAAEKSAHYHDRVARTGYGTIVLFSPDWQASSLIPLTCRWCKGSERENRGFDDVQMLITHCIQEHVNKGEHTNEYYFERKGSDAGGYTSFVKSQQFWGPYNLPPILGALQPLPGYQPMSKEEVLPARISRDVEGWEIEAWKRLGYKNVTDADIEPRFPQGNYAYLSPSARAGAWRASQGLFSWNLRSAYIDTGRRSPKIGAAARLTTKMLEANTTWDLWNDGTIRQPCPKAWNFSTRWNPYPAGPYAPATGYLPSDILLENIEAGCDGLLSDVHLAKSNLIRCIQRGNATLWQKVSSKLTAAVHVANRDVGPGDDKKPDIDTIVKKEMDLITGLPLAVEMDNGLRYSLRPSGEYESPAMEKGWINGIEYEVFMVRKRLADGRLASIRIDGKPMVLAYDGSYIEVAEYQANDIPGDDVAKYVERKELRPIGR